MIDWPHQAREFERHRDDPARALLWSMRTGKSKAVVDLARHLHGEGRIAGCLVVAPNGVHAQWVEQEFPRHGAGFLWQALAWRSASTDGRTTNHFLRLTPASELKVLALNAEALQIDRVQDLVAQFLTQTDGRVLAVFDESHLFRRPGARRTRLARGLARRCSHRRILTGTPALNSPLHLFSQFELLERGALGFTTFGGFKARYARFEQARTRDGRSYPRLLGYENLGELRDRVSRWSSVVLRAEAEGMPDLVRVERPAPLSDEQRSLYGRLRRETLLEVGDDAGPATVTAHLLKLQQVLSGFLLSDDGRVVELVRDPPRVRVMVEEVLGSDPRSAIVWCRFRHEIRTAVRALREAGVTAFEYHGGRNAAQRAAALEGFRDAPPPKAFVGQPQAAGQGLDLSAASAVIWLGHTHDAIVREQATERATRVGGGSVDVVDLVAPGTVDRAILSLTRRKRDVADGLTGRGLREALSAGSP